MAFKRRIAGRLISAFVGRPILAVGMVLLAQPAQVLRFSTSLGKAGRGASRGPGGPPHFGLVFDRAAGFQGGSILNISLPLCAYLHRRAPRPYGHATPE